MIKIAIMLVLISILIGEGARQIRLRRDRRGRTLPFSQNISGAEFAEKVLDAKGIQGVQIVESRALLTNHYLPETKTIRLSPQNYRGRNLAAIATAAHEAGHAIQHAQGFRPLRMRQGAIRFTQYGSVLVFFIAAPMMLFMPRVGLLVLGVGWALIRLNNLTTMPVEIDASGRIKDLMYNARLVKRSNEADTLEEMLHAAALEKVSGFLQFWSWLFSWIFPWKKG